MVRLLGIGLLAAVLGAQVAETVAEHVRRGVAAREAGLLNEAVRELRAAVRAAPGIAESHLYLGLVLHESKDFVTAAESLETALSLKPELPGARELLGYELLVLGRWEDAIPHLVAARSEEPGKWQVNVWLARALLQAGDARGALSCLTEIRAVVPSSPQVLYLAAKAHSDLAAQAQAELLDRSRESVYAHLAVAEDHDFNGRSEEALAAYRKALAVEEALPDAWLALGDLERNRGQHRAALEAYRRALAIRSDNGDLQLRCGEALLALGRGAEALPYLESAAADKPALAGADAVLAKALLDLGRFERAHAVLTRALERASDEQQRMKLHYQLARASRKLGETEEERRHLRQFSALRARLTAGDQ